MTTLDKFLFVLQQTFSQLDEDGYLHFRAVCLEEEWRRRGSPDLNWAVLKEKVQYFGVADNQQQIEDIIAASIYTK